MRPDASVMAAKAPRLVEADSDAQALHRRLNYFPTPPWAGRAGAELIGRLDPGGPWTAWEPACGEGHLAYALGPYFRHVWASDIHDHGGSLQAGAVVDFLGAEAADHPANGCDWIVTNPPFEAAADFVALGLARARRGVAMLCRLNWIESAGRYPLFFGDRPLAVFAPFAERAPMTLGRWDPKAPSATGYAWFVWLQPCVGAGGRPVIEGIPPGTRDRLTRPDDARLWGVKADAPLFDSLDEVVLPTTNPCAVTLGDA